MKDTEGRILARQIGKTLTDDEMELVNGSGTTTYTYRTGPPWAPDTGYGVDYEWSF